MSLRKIFFPIVALAMMICWTTPAVAQVLYGSVIGVLEDASGGLIPNATVSLTNKGTGQTYEAKTDEGGRYLISNVLPGSYDLKVTNAGFKTETYRNLGITANTVTRQNARLEVGSTSDTITVEAQATTLQTDKADTHTELNAQQISSLPLPGYRNYQSLINLVPGATPSSFQNSVTDTPGRSLRTNINGTNANNNMTRIDGAASVNLWLPHHTGYVMPAEMVSTVNVTTSAGDAEQGMAGGASITLVTKSGTNQFHGSAFEFHDNDHLKARNFFSSVKPIRTYNNYGATIGGPIKKNKLFFFYSFDGTRQRDGAFGTYSVPTADLRAGNFATTGTTIYDPATGAANGVGRQAFPGNMIPTSRISSAAQKIQANYPNPNKAGVNSNLDATGGPLFHRDYNDVKINWTRNEKSQVWGHYGIMKALVSGKAIFGDGVGPSPGASPGTGDTRVQNMSAGHNYTLGPNLLLDGVFGYQRQDQTVRGVDFGKNYSQILSIPGINNPNDIMASGFPNISIGGYNGFGVPGWMPLNRVEESYTTSHNLSYTKGAHLFRFGFDGVNHRMTHYQPELGAGPRGAIDFSGGPTTLNGGPSANNFNAYAAFLLGESNNVQKSIQYILMTPREFQFGWYAQDRWQVTRKLTVSLGLRYELYPLMTRATGKGLERLEPLTNQVCLGGRGNQPKGCGVTVSHKLFAPKAGLAYRIDEKSVFRMGYGINFDPLPFSRPLRGFYPLTVNFNFDAPNAYATARTFAQGIPDVQGPDLSTGIVNLPAVADMRSPNLGEIHRGYVQSWNATFERRLPQSVIVTLAYVGTQTVHQLADLDINSSSPGLGNAGRPFNAKFGRQIATNMWDGYLSSNYHSLQNSFRKQFSQGLMIQGSYTWSKAINMTDEDGWASVGWNWAPVFNRNRALAGYDRSHIFNVGWVYELPFGKGKSWASNGPAAYIVGGWSVGGIMAAYTGTPFTVGASGTSLNIGGSNAQTADQVKPEVTRLSQAGPGTFWYDASAFEPVTTTRFGSTGRNILRNPGVWNTDLSLNRTFVVTERVKIEFRGEATNFPNTSHFGGMASTSVANKGNNFLSVRSAFGERQARFGLRVQF